MASVPVIDFIEKRGDTLDYLITATGVDLTQSGTGLWFTGQQVKGAPDAGAVWQKTIGSGIVVTSPTTATATLLPANTAALTDLDSVFYDVQLKTPAAAIHTLYEGTITFEIDVTQSTS